MPEHFASVVRGPLDHVWRWVRKKRFPVVAYGDRLPGVVDQLRPGKVPGAGAGLCPWAGVSPGVSPGAGVKVAAFVAVVVAFGLIVWQVAAWTAKAERVHRVRTEHQAGVVSQ